MQGKHDPIDDSSYHKIRHGLAPAIIFHGSDDKTVPVETVKDFKDKMIKNNNICELYIYDGYSHVITDYPEINKKTKKLALDFMLKILKN